MFQFFNAVVGWFFQIFWAYRFSVAVVGIEGVGKTSIVNRLAGEGFSSVTKPTVGFKDTKISYGNVTITCWDISGQENYRPHWNRYCAGQDVIIFVIDSSTPSALEKGRQELCNLIFQDDLRDTPVLILVNKADLTAGQYTENIQRESSTVMVPKEINEALRLDTEIIRQQPDRKVACFHVSAKTGSNFRAVELWLVALATNMN